MAKVTRLKKPPLGLTPSFLYEEKREDAVWPLDLARYKEIRAAIKRYKTAKKIVPPEWVVEAAMVKNRVNSLYLKRQSMIIAKNSIYGVFGIKPKKHGN